MVAVPRCAVVPPATWWGSDPCSVPPGISRIAAPRVAWYDVGCASLRPRADNPFLRNTSRVAEGQVFTIEPGIRNFTREVLAIGGATV